MELNKCFGCMEEIQGYPCPHCGFDLAENEKKFPVASTRGGSRE